MPEPATGKSTTVRPRRIWRCLLSCALLNCYVQSTPTEIGERRTPGIWDLPGVHWETVVTTSGRSLVPAGLDNNSYSPAIRRWPTKARRNDAPMHGQMVERARPPHTVRALGGSWRLRPRGRSAACSRPSGDSDGVLRSTSRLSAGAPSGGFSRKPTFSRNSVCRL